MASSKFYSLALGVSWERSKWSKVTGLGGAGVSALFPPPVCFFEPRDWWNSRSGAASSHGGTARLTTHSPHLRAAHIQHPAGLSLLGLHPQESDSFSSWGTDFLSHAGIKWLLYWLDNMERIGSKNYFSFQVMGLSALARTNSPLYSPQTCFFSHISLQGLFVPRVGSFPL